MKIYLINLPAQFMINDNVHVPMGLMYLHEYLKLHGIDVSILDLSGNAEWDIPMDGDIYGVSARSAQWYLAKRFAERVKMKDNWLVLGGNHGTFLPEECLENSKFDTVVVGEGELALLDFISNPRKGIIRKPRMQHIDVFPHPRLEALDMEKWNPRINLSVGNEDLNLPGTGIITTRGCPYSCIFCASRSMWKGKITYHTPRYIEKWVDYLHGMGIDNYFIHDDTFALSPRRFVELCKIFGKYNGMWRCSIRGDLINEKSVKLLANNGCKMICLGVETASQRLLDILKKHEKVEDNAKAIELCHEHGIGVKACFMTGLPTEMQEDIDLTKKFIIKHNLEAVAVGIFIPYPGCEIFNNPDKYGYTIKNNYDYRDFWTAGCDHNTPCVNPKIEDQARRFKKQLDDTAGDKDMLVRLGKIWRGWNA